MAPGVPCHLYDEIRTQLVHRASSIMGEPAFDYAAPRARTNGSRRGAAVFVAVMSVSVRHQWQTHYVMSM